MTGVDVEGKVSERNSGATLSRLIGERGGMEKARNKWGRLELNVNFRSNFFHSENVFDVPRGSCSLSLL